MTDQIPATPLLLIHGFPLDGRIWDKVTPGIRIKTLVIPDLPGHGKSPQLPGPVSIEDYAREMLKIMDFAKAERFAVAGHSMGGYIAFALLRLAPERISALALVSSRALPDNDEMKKTREATAQRAEKEGPGFLAATMPDRAVGSSPPPGVVDTLRKIIREAKPKGVAADSRAMAARPDATPQLGQIKVPTLVFAGRGDKIVPAAESEAMAKAIPGAKLVWCENSGHVPMLEEPELVARELTELMKGLQS
jgi:pimeloyl-ACP methyl ester carboxylesterase